MDLRTCSHDFIIEFINAFRDCPCLWQTKSSEYKNKVNRLAAYNKLVEIAKKYEPNSDITDIKKKIQSLRASHRKERNKVKASMRTGSGVEDLYQPKLWYYKELHFLNDPIETTASMSTLRSDDDETRIQVSTQDSLNDIISPPPSLNSLPEQSSQTPSPATTPEPPSFTWKRKDDNVNHMFSLISQRLSQKDDEFDIFGKNVAIKLRTVTKEQKMLSEKLINDVIFYGQMQRLSVNSEVNVGHGNVNYFTATAPVNTRSSICTSSATTLPQYQVLTPTDDQLLLRAPASVNTSSSNFTSTISTLPQFQVQTATDNQQVDSGNSNELSYFVSNYLP